MIFGLLLCRPLLPTTTTNNNTPKEKDKHAKFSWTRYRISIFISRLLLPCVLRRPLSPFKARQLEFSNPEPSCRPPLLSNKTKRQLPNAMPRLNDCIGIIPSPVWPIESILIHPCWISAKALPPLQRQPEQHPRAHDAPLFPHHVPLPPPPSRRRSAPVGPCHPNRQRQQERPERHPQQGEPIVNEPRYRLLLLLLLRFDCRPAPNRIARRPPPPLPPLPANWRRPEVRKNRHRPSQQQEHRHEPLPPSRRMVRPKLRLRLLLSP